MEDLRSRILERKLIEEGEFNDLMRDLRRHLDVPGTFVMSHIFIQAWGRKPGAEVA